MSATEVRAQLSKILNAAAVRGQVTYITQHGQRIAAVVPVPLAELAETATTPEGTTP